MIKKIENQNARIVKLLGRVADTRDKIRQSDDFAVQMAGCENDCRICERTEQRNLLPLLKQP